MLVKTNVRGGPCQGIGGAGELTQVCGGFASNVILIYVLRTDGADVLYNNFNVTSSTAPENPPSDTNSQYNCVVATTDGYWRLSQCTDEHRVVCQSG